MFVASCLSVISAPRSRYVRSVRSFRSNQLFFAQQLLRPNKRITNFFPHLGKTRSTNFTTPASSVPPRIIKSSVTSAHQASVSLAKAAVSNRRLGAQVVFWRRNCEKMRQRWLRARSSEQRLHRKLLKSVSANRPEAFQKYLARMIKSSRAVKSNTIFPTFIRNALNAIAAKSPSGIRHDKDIVAFSVFIFNLGGAALYSVLQPSLFLPSVSTVLRFRRAATQLREGMSDAAVKSNISAIKEVRILSNSDPYIYMDSDTDTVTVISLFIKFHKFFWFWQNIELSGAKVKFWMICDDATKILSQPHVCLKSGRIYGLNGSPLPQCPETVNGLLDFLDANADNLGEYAQVSMLVPILEAGSKPLAAQFLAYWCTNNRFDSSELSTRHSILFKAIRDVFGPDGPWRVICDGSDGDSRFVDTLLMVELRGHSLFVLQLFLFSSSYLNLQMNGYSLSTDAPPDLDPIFTLRHPAFVLWPRQQFVSNQDTFHIGTKIVNAIRNPNKYLLLGRYRLSLQPLRDLALELGPDQVPWLVCFFSDFQCNNMTLSSIWCTVYSGH